MSSLIDSLWARYRSARDETARHELLDQYLGLVYHAAREIERTVPRHLEFEELVSAGTLGLMQAIEAFDPCRGHAFSSYAMPRIRGAILDEVRGWEWVPRSVRDRSRIVAAKLGQLRGRLGREPLLEEVAAELGVDVATCRIWMEEAEGPVVLPFDAEIRIGDSKGLRLADAIPDPSQVAPEEVMEADRQGGLLRAALASLSEKDQTVLALFYFEELSQRQVARILHLTESRISQIRTRALRRLRERISDSDQAAA